jgi:hypothetical protein
VAKCDWCEKEMTDKTVRTCEANSIVGFPDGKSLPAIPYNPDYGGADQRCHDCNIARGGCHHPGCDMERCPKCGGQLISCGCLDGDWEEDDVALITTRRAEETFDRKIDTLRQEHDPADAALHRLMNTTEELKKFTV